MNNAPLQLKEPIFLLSSERSGSNLIRVMLDAHPNLSAPPPPHLFSIFLPILPYYGSMSEGQNVQKLCEDVITALKVQTGTWKSSFASRDLVREINPGSFIRLYDYVYDQERRQDDKPRVFIKENDVFHHAYYVLQHYPDAKFIYLVRDGRDFVLSYKKSASHFGSLKDNAVRWAEEQHRCLTLYHHLHDQGKILAIHYEDLISDSEESMKNICTFLDEPFSVKTLEYYKKESTQSDAKKTKNWQNLNKPVIKKNFGKYKIGLSKKEIKVFESIAFDELVMAGYLPEYSRIQKKTKSISLLRKGLSFMNNILHGRTMSLSELNMRRKTFSQINSIKTKRREQPRPLLRCKAIENNG